LHWWSDALIEHKHGEIFSIHIMLGFPLNNEFTFVTKCVAMNLIKFKKLSIKLDNRSRASVQRDMELRGLPKPVITLGKTVYWDEDAVDSWLEQLATIPYSPNPVAMPKPGKRRGRKRKTKHIEFMETSEVYCKECGSVIDSNH